jgi:hypothetical protein
LQKARRTADQARLEKKGTPVERALAKIANAVLIMEGNVATKKKKQGEGRYVSKEEARVEEERMMEDMQAMGGKLGETLSLLEDLRDTERKKEAGKSLTKEQQLLRLEQAVLLQKARSNSTGGEPAPHPDCEVCAYRMDSEGNVVTSSLSAEDAALLAWARAHKKQIQQQKKKAALERAKLKSMLAMATSHATTLVDSDRTYEQEFTDEDRMAHREKMASSGKHAGNRRASHFKRHVLQRQHAHNAGDAEDE